MNENKIYKIADIVDIMASYSNELDCVDITEERISQIKDNIDSIMTPEIVAGYEKYMCDIAKDRILEGIMGSTTDIKYRMTTDYENDLTAIYKNGYNDALQDMQNQELLEAEKTALTIISSKTSDAVNLEIENRALEIIRSLSMSQIYNIRRGADIPAKHNA